MKAITIILFTLACVVLFTGIVFSLNSKTNSQLTTHGWIKTKDSEHRIAVLIPFIGDGPESIPPYLNLFVTAAAGSSSLVDFFIFHNGALDSFYYDDLPSNVKIISMGSVEGMVQQFLRVVDQRQGEDFELKSREFLVQVLNKHLLNYPYVLVEFKPALGHIFASYISGYTHWAYSDLDIAFGDLSRWITKEELEKFDIVTYGFGDADRAYLRGQFTMHRNDPSKINQLWRDCDYLSKMDKRFADILSGAAKIHIESAEACYSVQVLKRDDVKVKFAVKAFTDVHQEDSAYTHGMYLGMGSKGESSVVYKAEPGQGMTLLGLNRVWFEQPNYTQGELQEERGQKGAVQWRNDPSIDCMYWVREIYRSQLCIQGADATDTIFLENGKLLKQTYKNINLPSHIASAPFFHFQEWKRVFRYNQNAAFDRKSATTWVLTKEGALPLPQRGDSTVVSVPSPLGIAPSKWRGTREQMPRHPYCIITGQRKFPPSPPAAACELMIWWRNSEQVEILANAPSWRQLNAAVDVTLALTLQISAELAAQNLEAALDVAIANVEAWQRQPCVLVVHLAGATDRISQRARERLATIRHDGCLVALLAHERSVSVSRKALMNMAVDAAPTRWVVSGIELERGLIISREASMFCSRRAKIHRSHRGQILILPQFAVAEAEGSRSMSVHDMLDLKATSSSSVLQPSDFEQGSCEEDAGSNSVFSDVDDLWWRFTTMEIQGVSLVEKQELMHRLASAFDDLELSFVNMMIDGENLEELDNSPVLMIDNLGPHQGIYTSTFVREVEEFAGNHCYNGLRLAQLAALGYEFYSLFGAFVVSTPRSRSATTAPSNDNSIGARRCDGCIMLQGQLENVQEHILVDERTRVAKAAMLWSEV